MWWKVAGVVGALGILLGAFGAHALKDHVTPEGLERWHTASRYHLLHAVALLAVAAHPGRPTSAGWAFLIGILLFSGSLYTMALTGQRWLGAITPLGGLSFIVAWVLLGFARLPEP